MDYCSFDVTSVNGALPGQTCAFYPSIGKFVSLKVSEDPFTQEDAPIRILLPFKDQESTDTTQTTWRPVEISARGTQDKRSRRNRVKVREDKPTLVNQQCDVYHC